MATFKLTALLIAHKRWKIVSLSVQGMAALMIQLSQITSLPVSTMDMLVDSSPISSHLHCTSNCCMICDCAVLSVPSCLSHPQLRLLYLFPCQMRMKANLPIPIPRLEACSVLQLNCPPAQLIHLSMIHHLHRPWRELLHRLQQQPYHFHPRHRDLRVLRNRAVPTLSC